MATTDPRTELYPASLSFSHPLLTLLRLLHTYVHPLYLCALFALTSPEAWLASPFSSSFSRARTEFLCVPSLSSILLFLSSTSHHVVVTSNTRILPVCRANSLLISSTMFRPRALSPSRDICTRSFLLAATQLEANFPVQSVAPPTTRLCPLPASGYNS